MRYHLTPIRMTTIEGKKKKNKRTWRNWNSWALLMET